MKQAELQTILLSVFIGLTLGNFFWQLVYARNWSTAFERSFFQFIALLCVWITVTALNWKDK